MSTIITHKEGNFGKSIYRAHIIKNQNQTIGQIFL